MLFEGNDRRALEKLKKSEGLLPPGQSLTLKWPVLQYGSVPSFDAETWDLRITGLVDSPLKLNWKESTPCPESSAPAISIASPDGAVSTITGTA